MTDHNNNNNHNASTDLDSAIENMYTEGGYNKLILHLKHDSEHTYKRIKEIADSLELSQNPKFKKQFGQLPI